MSWIREEPDGSTSFDPWGPSGVTKATRHGNKVTATCWVGEGMNLKILSAEVAHDGQCLILTFEEQDNDGDY